MSLIQVKQLTFAYDNSPYHVFENVSFQIDSSWKLGFAGRNGRGKTTFLKLLLGDYEYRGTISSGIAFEYFPFEVNDKERWPVEVLEEICPGLEQWRLLREINLLELSADVLYRPFYTLSFGEQTKLLLAALFLKENRFLLIDEPTNHLDVQARKVLAEYLNKKSGFILVSHDRNFLDQCIDHILVINRSDIQVQQGNFSSWYANKQAQDEFEIAQDKKIRGDIKRLSEAARRSSQWSDRVESTKTGTRIAGLRPDRGHIGHQAAKMMKRAKCIENRKLNAIEEKSGLLKNIETADSLKMLPLPYHTDILVRFRDAGICYGQKEVCRGLTFSVCRGDRIRLSGKNGCGKSSVLKALLGEVPLSGGELSIGSGLNISYISQDTSFLKGTLRELAENQKLEKSLFLAVLRKLDFERNQFEKRVEDYSEGQKKKVLLAASLCRPAHLYVWDEPLNFIDLFSRIQIEELLLSYKPTMIFVEHDSSFAEKIATRTIEIGCLEEFR